MALTAPLPATRTTGDTPASGVAGDVNLLVAAITELRAVAPVVLTQAAYNALVTAGTVNPATPYYVKG